MSSDGIASVHTYSVAISNLLDKARHVKVNPIIEPALNASDFAGGIEDIGKLSDGSFLANGQAHYAAIETACRNIFYDLLVRRFLFLLELENTEILRPRRRLTNQLSARYGIYLISFPFYLI